MGAGIQNLALLLPLVVILMISENWLARRLLGRACYEWRDTVAGLGVGVGYFAVAAFVGVLDVLVYRAVYQHWAIFDLGSGWPAMAFGLVAVDLCYYVYHRASHRMNALWAIHVVHHHGAEVNFSTNLRLPWLLPAYKWVFYLPLALLGMSPAIYVAMRTVNFLYNFFLHTPIVPKLGRLEYVLNTPSHHRVHHAYDAAYIDHNYASMFIVWDRMFGTFVPETTPGVYGVVTPPRTCNPIWLNVGPWAELLRRARGLSRTVDRLQVWVRPPDWIAQGEVPKVHGRAQVRAPTSGAPRAAMSMVVFGGLLVATAATLRLVWSEHSPSSASKAILFALAMVALWVAAAAEETRAPRGSNGTEHTDL